MERSTALALTERYTYPLIGYLTRRSGDRMLAEDLVQEVSIRFLRRFQDVPESHGRQYLYRAAMNAYIDWQRRHRQDNCLVPFDLLVEDRTAVDERPGPHELTEQTLLRELVQAAVSVLTPDYAIVVRLRMQGYRQSDVAALLGIPLGTVKSRWNYAAGRLRKLLNDAV